MGIDDKIEKYLNEGNIVKKSSIRSYKWWVVVDNKIHSGWVNKKYAYNELNELPKDKKGKIYSKEDLKKINLDPYNDKDWNHD